MQFGPIRLILLICWIYLCMYSVHADDPYDNRYATLGYVDSSQMQGIHALSGSATLPASGTNFTFDYDYDDSGDDRGNLEEDEHFVYEWDDFNRIIKVTDKTYSGSTPQYVEYLYDALGRRVAMKYTGQSSGWDDVMLVYDGYMVIEERNLDDSGNLVRSYYYESGINKLAMVEEGANTYVPLIDDRGTLMGAANTSGTVIEKLYYNATGLCKSYNGSDIENTRGGGQNIGKSEYIPFGWLGMYHDPFTGKYHTHFREYDPIHERWLNEDPAGYTNGLNLYAAYMGVNGIDPLGLDLFVTKEKQKSLNLFFGEDNISYDKERSKDSYKVILGDGAVDHLNKYDGDPEFKRLLLSYIRSGVRSTLPDVQQRLIENRRPRPQNMGWIADKFGPRLVANPKKFQQWQIDTWGGQVDPELGHKLMKAYVSGMAEMIAWELGAIAVEAYIVRIGRSAYVYRKMSLADDVIRAKPSLPAPRATPRYIWSGHRTAAVAEGQLARTIQLLPDEVVIRWGDKIGAHGSDAISVNMKTAGVTLWDGKFRSLPVRIKGSPTFTPHTDRLENAVLEAILTLGSDTALPPQIRLQALDNLRAGVYQTRTVGMGAAKNSVLR